MNESNQFATFFVNGIFFGIEVRKVQEVIRYQEMTRVPKAPSMIQGLMNLRGQIVTAVDLRSRLEMPPRPSDAMPMNVVVRSEGGATSLLVDEIGDVVEVDDQSREVPPETVTGTARGLITAVYKLKSRLLLILDMERAINLPALTRSKSN